MKPSSHIKKIVSWLRMKIKEASAKGIVVGVSGGIDSAVVAALCRMALGSSRVLCLILPCLTLDEEIKDAKSICKKLKLKYKIVNLTPVYKNMLKILPAADKIARGNLKPRMRMLTLYYFSNKHNYLVAGTGNKSELMLGYFTKYGDGGVDILPIGGLVKGEVLAVAREIGISEKIINKKPTAGLWPGQTDEEEMGLTYEYIDTELKRAVSGKDIRNKRMKELMKKARHKLAMPEIFKGSRVKG
ncbi:MAG: NAD+ synthase [Elusimicrobiota bacterium]